MDFSDVERDSKPQNRKSEGNHKQNSIPVEPSILVVTEGVYGMAVKSTQNEDER